MEIMMFLKSSEEVGFSPCWADRRFPVFEESGASGDSAFSSRWSLEGRKPEKNKIKRGGLGSTFYVHLIKFQNYVL